MAGYFGPGGSVAGVWAASSSAVDSVADSEYVAAASEYLAGDWVGECASGAGADAYSDYVAAEGSVDSSE